MRTVRAERVAECPFSAACEWVLETLRARNMLCRRRADLADPGRAHDEVEVCPPVPFGAALRARVRLRIERLRTRIIVEGDAAEDTGRIRDVLDGVLNGIIADLEARERDRRAPARALRGDETRTDAREALTTR